MIKGLNRPMFSGMQQPTGLGGYYGAFGGGQMPQGGIMKYAPGGEVDKEEADSVAENYVNIRPGSPAAYFEGRGGESFRGDLAEFLGTLRGGIPQLQRGVKRAFGYEDNLQGEPVPQAIGMFDQLFGVENRLPSETFLGQDTDYVINPETGEARPATAMDDPSMLIPASQAEEINAALRGEAEKAIADPQANEAAAAVVGDADQKIAKAEEKNDIYGGMLALVPDAQVSDDPEENRKEVMRRLQQQASSMGIELADDEADPQTNPHIGTALILAGAAMMQQTGNVGQAIGKGLETGASFLANKAEKEAERAADIEEATIRSMYGGTDAAVIQEAREAKRVYGAAFPNATDADFFNFAVRSTQADPALVEQTLVDNMLKEGSEESASVASNYAKMFVNSQTASGLGEDNPKVAIGPNGQTFTIREMEARASEFLKQPEAKSSGITSIPKAINAMGYRPIPLDQISKMSNIPAEGE